MQGYRGLGAESIFLMFQEPCANYADAIHFGQTCGIPEAHTPAQLVECFLRTDYGTKSHVPRMFIPACGQVGLKCFCLCHTF